MAAESVMNQDQASATVARQPPTAGFQIRDRVRELRRVPACELVAHPKNWRKHPRAQANALRGLLAAIGYADALLTRELANGHLQILDGHLRAATTPHSMVPALIIDVNEAEAEKILATFDPLASLAESDSERFKALIQTGTTNSPAVEDLLRQTAGDRVWRSLHPNELRDVEVPTERADELRKKWGTDTGQLWRTAPHRRPSWGGR